MTRWEEHAACSGKPTQWWFPQKTGFSAEIERALHICRSCPVQLDCARHAQDKPEYWGIWGGLTEEQRRKARRTPPSIHGSHASYLRHIAAGQPACEECKRGHALYMASLRARPNRRML